MSGQYFKFCETEHIEHLQYGGQKLPVTYLYQFDV